MKKKVTFYYRQIVDKNLGYKSSRDRTTHPSHHTDQFWHWEMPHFGADVSAPTVKLLKALLNAMVTNQGFQVNTF